MQGAHVQDSIAPAREEMNDKAAQAEARREAALAQLKERRRVKDEHAQHVRETKRLSGGLPQPILA